MEELCADSLPGNGATCEEELAWWGSNSLKGRAYEDTHLVKMLKNVTSLCPCLHHVSAERPHTPT